MLNFMTHRKSHIISILKIIKIRECFEALKYIINNNGCDVNYQKFGCFNK